MPSSALSVGLAAVLYPSVLTSEDGETAFAFLFVPFLQLGAFLLAASLAGVVRLGGRGAGHP